MRIYLNILYYDTLRNWGVDPNKGNRTRLFMRIDEEKDDHLTIIMNYPYTSPFFILFLRS